MKPSPNIPRAVLLPVIGFAMLLSLTKILGSTLMFSRVVGNGTEETMRYLDGIGAGLFLLLVCIWLWRKVWAIKPAVGSPSRATAQ